MQMASSPAIAGSGVAATGMQSQSAGSSGIRWWPALVLVAILLAAAALFYVRRESTRLAAPTPPTKPDSMSPVPIQTAPLPGVQSPPLEPGRVVKPDPPAPDKVEPPKAGGADKSKTDEKKTNPPGAKQ